MRVFQTLYASSGNAPPQLAVTRRLVDEGHEVLVLAHEASRRRVEATGADVVPFRTVHPAMDSSRPETDPLRDWEVRSPLAAGQRLRDRLYLEPIAGTARGVGGGDGEVLAGRRAVRLHAPRSRHRRRGGARARGGAGALPLPVPDPGRPAVRARPAVAEDGHRTGVPGRPPQRRRTHVETRDREDQHRAGRPRPRPGRRLGPPGPGCSTRPGLHGAGAGLRRAGDAA